MNGAERGFRDMIVGVLSGFILSALLGILSKLPMMPASYVAIFQLIEVFNLLGSIFLIFAMESWGIGYLVGWLFATWVISSAGLVEPWLFPLYAVVGIPTLIVKALRKAGLK